MAMIRVAPVRVDVRTNWLDGRPREIAWGERRLPVIAVAAVRDESSAYPVVVGPRTVFEVDTPLARWTTRAWAIGQTRCRCPQLIMYVLNFAVKF